MALEQQANAEVQTQNLMQDQINDTRVRIKMLKRPWTSDEDSKLFELVGKYGPKKWSFIAAHIPGRVGKQCRERWQNHLNPQVARRTKTTELC